MKTTLPCTATANYYGLQSNVDNTGNCHSNINSEYFFVNDILARKKQKMVRSLVCIQYKPKRASKIREIAPETAN